MQEIITSEGQITLPKAVRDRLGLVAGDAVMFEWAADGRVVMTRAERLPGRFAALRDTADAGLTTDEIMALARGEAAER